MSPDNSSGIFKQDKSSPAQSNCSLSNPPHMDHISPSLPHFTARPFPPPALADVPIDYIVDQLHNLAPHYWNNPETADCTIIVPVPNHQPQSTPYFPATSSGSSPDPSIRLAADPNATGRRATEPDIHVPPRLTMRLHMDYLSAKSSFLRGLFSGASPLDLIQALHLSPSGRHFHVPPSRLPRLLPSSPSDPVVFLPVPDPHSIHLLFHWMYFGNTDHIETCLDQGVVHWEGLARNVEYLGLPTEIKVFLGRWYGNWRLPSRTHRGRTPYGDDPDDDSDVELDYEDDLNDSEAESDDLYSSSSSHTHQDMQTIFEECGRGRTQAVRPLARLCGQFQMCSA